MELINFNVSTYLPSIYLDFGISGVFIFNFIIGILGAVLFFNVQKDNTNKDVLLYCIFVHNIVLLFFTNMFLYLPIIVQWVYIYIIFNEKERKKDDKSFCNNTSI